MDRQLEMVYTAGNSTITIRVKRPKEGLTMDEVRTAAAKIWPVLKSRQGIPADGLKSAKIVTTTIEELK